MDPKVYLTVLVEYSIEGCMTPREIVWEDGRRFSVGKVLDCRRAASYKAGGQGTRYTCKIHGKETYLFFENDTKWFMERKGVVEPTKDLGPSFNLKV